MTSSRMLGVSPLRKKEIVSPFPMVYPASLASSSNLAMYWLTSGKCILHPSRSSCALCWRCESRNCLSNSCWNCSQTRGMLSSIGWSLSIHWPMSHAQPATSFPLMNVRVMATFLIGESNPATPVLALKYPRTSSMKLSALDLFPLKMHGKVPIVRTSAVTGIGTCGAGAAGSPPPLGWPPPGFPPGGPPPGFPPGGPFLLKAACKPACTRCSGVVPEVGVAVLDPEDPMVVVWVVATVVVFDILGLDCCMTNVAMLEHCTVGGRSMCGGLCGRSSCIGEGTSCSGSIMTGEFLTLDKSASASVSVSVSDSG